MTSPQSATALSRSCRSLRTTPTSLRRSSPRLEKEAAEEADAKAFCDKETSESKAKQAELTAKSDKYAVRIEKATATIAELTEQIKTLQAQMAEMDAAQAEATS